MEQDKEIKNIPDAIVIPTAGTVRGEDGIFRSTSYEDGDAFGVLGGYARVEAAAVLASKFPKAVIVTTGKGAGDGKTPSHAEVMKRELIQLGVESQRIVMEEKSTSTKSGITEALELARKKEWKSILFVTNDYHLQRFKLMVEMTNPQLKIDYVSAEDLISTERPSFKEEFEKIKTRTSYLKRLEAESRGIEALQSGKYKEAPIEDKKERLV